MRDSEEIVAAIFAAARCGVADREAYLKEWAIFQDMIFERRIRAGRLPEGVTLEQVVEESYRNPS